MTLVDCRRTLNESATQYSAGYDSANCSMPVAKELRLSAEIGKRTLLGVLTPSSNTVLEPITCSMLAADVAAQNTFRRAIKLTGGAALVQYAG